MKSILVIAAHPDDEVLGCGGTIVKHIQNGDEVHVLIIAEGVTSRDEERNPIRRKESLSKLKKMAHKAHKILGSNNIKLMDFPDNRMDSVDLLEIIKAVEKEINIVKPEIIYTHHYGDLNIDHRITHQAVLTACRPEPLRCVKRILTFEVQSSTEWQSPNIGTVFSPNVFIDISDTLSLKIDALKAYQSEMKPWPHSRSIKAVEHLAHWRGATVGLNAVEAFMLIRELD